MVTGVGFYLVVFGLYVLFIILTTVKSLRQVESLSDFTTGGHRMGLFLGIGTSLATWVSVASVMGVPGYLYRTGVAAIIGWVAGWFFGTALIPIVAYKIRKPEIPARTFPEFIHIRYEPFSKISNLQILVALLMFIGYFIFSHLQVVGFGIVFSTITGIRYEYAIFGFLVFLIFTSMGGFWSVAATDTLNAFLIMAGVIFGCGAVLSATGGLDNIMQAISTTTAPVNVGGDPLPEGIMLNPVGTFGFAALFSIFISNSLGASVAPHWVTRMMAPKNTKAAVMQMMGTVLCLIIVFIPLIIIGLGAKALLPSLPVDKTTDYILPTIITQYAHPLVGALTLVGILAAAVSTANSMLLHCGTSIYYDIYRNLFPNKEPDEKKANMHLRICIFILGTIAVITAIKPPLLLAMGFTYVYGGFGAAFFWPVFLGLYWKRMNRAGAYTGIIVGALAYAYGTATKFSNPFLLGACLSLVAVLIAVYATQKPPKEAYEAYFENEISPSTMETILAIRQDNDELNKFKGAPATKPGAEIAK